jgi:hypothetical protein
MFPNQKGVANNVILGKEMIRSHERLKGLIHKDDSFLEREIKYKKVNYSNAHLN